MTSPVARFDAKVIVEPEIVNDEFGFCNTPLRDTSI
jgi:hypothetical protein